MGNIFPAKVAQIRALSPSTRNTSATARAELKEKISNWKKKAWLDFCKLMMAEDKRFTLMPLADYNAKTGASSMVNRVQNADGVFSNFCLTRTGEMSDIYLVPCDPMLGVKIDAGSKYSQATIQGFPSRAMVWPIIRIADELERQYAREVSIEANKHGSPTPMSVRGRDEQGRLVNGTTSDTNSQCNANSISTDSEADGQ